MTPEQRARQGINSLPRQVSRHICSLALDDIHATVGVAIREFALNPGHGLADYLHCANNKACGVMEARQEGILSAPVQAQTPSRTPLACSTLPQPVPRAARQAPLLPSHRRKPLRRTHG